jgi:hypothetical protein
MRLGTVVTLDSDLGRVNSFSTVLHLLLCYQQSTPTLQVPCDALWCGCPPAAYPSHKHYGQDPGRVPRSKDDPARAPLFGTVGAWPDALIRLAACLPDEGI